MAAKPASPGAPAWMATFADLMSLLLAFFVLLFSFSELDAQKYKEVAGSMRDAFGVQRIIYTKQPPRGLNIIAREFSPGKPVPTNLNQVRQFTTKDSLKYPLLGGPHSAMSRDHLDKASKKHDRERIQMEFKDEIAKGIIEVEILDRKIVVRIREKGSFPSGSERLETSFLPVIQRLAQTLKDTRGQIVVSGHTDSIPIDNSRFPSNWELSAARAASFANVFLSEDLVSRGGIHLEAYADTKPVDTNESPEGRARNRRVELALVYGEDILYDEMGEKGPVSTPREEPVQRGADK